MTIRLAGFVAAHPTKTSLASTRPLLVIVNWLAAPFWPINKSPKLFQSEPVPVTRTVLLLLEPLNPSNPIGSTTAPPLVMSTEFAEPEAPTLTSCRLVQSEPLPLTTKVLPLLEALIPSSPRGSYTAPPL